MPALVRRSQGAGDHVRVERNEIEATGESPALSEERSRSGRPICAPERNGSKNHGLRNELNL